MESIKLVNKVKIPFTAIREYGALLEISFNSTTLDVLKAQLMNAANVTVIEVLTEGDAVASVILGYAGASKFVIEGDSITVTLPKRNLTEEKFISIDAQLDDLVNTIVMMTMM